MPRPPRPEDLYEFRIATDPRLSPDGRLVAFTVQVAGPRRDGYRTAIWLVPADGSGAARQLTLGAKSDSSPRFSPDGRSLAFLSDRRLLVEDADPAEKDEREDGTQVHLLPLDGGEARRVTDLPRGVEGFAWSPDGRHLAVLSGSLGATREEDSRRRRIRRQPRRPADPPPPDYRYIDRLMYQFNGRGFIFDRPARLWVVDVSTGEARPLVADRGPVESPTWSPDGRRIAFASNRRPDRDLGWHSAIWVVDVGDGRLTRVTDQGESYFFAPAWSADGRSILALGHRYPAAAGSRNDIWRFAADGSESGRDDGTDLSAEHDLMPGASMATDVVPSEPPRLVPVDGDRRVVFTAPMGGATDLWQLDIGDGSLERLTEGHHHVSAIDGVEVDGRARIAFLRSSPTELPDVHVLDLDGAPRGKGRGATAGAARLTRLNDTVLADLALVEPVERWVRVDGLDIQGWYLPPAGRPAPAPLVVQIHGGPHTFYGWSPFWEFQVLAGAGIGVWYANPRGSEGYGQDFNAANFRDWGDGPMRDVLAGVDALVADGLADPGCLGVAGGSYGGYLTNWIVAHDRRFAAAMTARCVSDLTTLMLTGDISGGHFGRLEFGAAPWEDPDFYRAASPLTHADRIRTPLLIQHSEADLRTTIAQAEALFTVLREHRRPVRMMRVPGETHELTRSGTPFRRVENLVQARDWFEHYLVKGRRRLPPVPRPRVARAAP